jgi:hypothetical protein
MSVYDTQINSLLTDPNSFQGTPGYQFAYNQGIGALDRSANARGMGYSGNALGDLVKYGTGLATQNYGDFLKTMIQGQGQQQQYDLGLGRNQNEATNIANQYQLGTQSNANNQWRNQADFGLGMYNAGNNFALGTQRNANDAAANWWNAGTNQQNANTNQYNAQTQRGAAGAQDWWRSYGALGQG